MQPWRLEGQKLAWQLGMLQREDPAGLCSLAGTYICSPDDVPRVGLQTAVPCPYCKNGMWLAVVRVSRIRTACVDVLGGMAAGQSDLIPATHDVYMCLPCRQVFTVDRAQLASLTASA